MKFLGREIATDKINFVMNCVSFVLGVIFFIRMQYKMSDQPASTNFNAERDSLIKIETRVNIELKEIKRVQDSISKVILKNESLLQEQIREVKQKRTALYSTIHSEWDNLTLAEQRTYLNKLMSNLKQKSK